MFIQRILALFDKVISTVFGFTEVGTGDQKGDNVWTYFFDFGRLISIVGVDGKIHTTSTYSAVRHYRKGKKLLKRIPVRKDLKKGERLATQQETHERQLKLREELSRAHSGVTDIL